METRCADSVSQHVLPRVKLLTDTDVDQAEGSDATRMGQRGSEAQGTLNNVRLAGAANQSQRSQSGT